MKKILIISLLFAFTLTNAQNIKRGYKSLEKKDYQKAKESFEKTLSDDRDNIGANLGLALILADDSDSLLFDAVDSWQYIERIEGKTGTLSQEDIDIIGEYFLSAEVHRSNRPVKKKIDIAIEAIEARLIKYIREENNLEAVYEVLERYPNFRFYDNVIHIRNQFEFRKYEKQNTLDAYREFISKFPDAAQVDKARKSIYKLAFENTRSQNTLAAYTSYIMSYPESEYIQSIIKLRNAAAFTEAKKINTLEAYDRYINEYPDALEVSEARSLQQELLYAQARRIKSIEAFNDFIKRYPDGRYFVDIFNLKSTELGTNFLRSNNFNNPSIMWARGLDNSGSIEWGGALAITPEGGYIVACNTQTNDSSYADAWIVKLDAGGKMVWNKMVGQPYKDSVVSVLIDSQGDIIVVGYTWLSAESGSNMGWMFKLGEDGKKLWNKNLGKIDIQACAIDQNDKIYIGGGIEEDTLGANYALTVFNNNAKIQAQRVYTGRGKIMDIKCSKNGKVLLAGTNWLAMLDQKRYLIWDDSLKASLKANVCAIASDGGCYFTGSGNDAIFYAKYNADGKKAWLQEYPKTDNLQKGRAIATTNTSALILEQKTDGAKLKLIGLDGKVTGVKEFFGNINPESAESKENEMIIVFSNGDLIVTKLSDLISL